MSGPGFWKRLKFFTSFCAKTVLMHDAKARPHWNQITDSGLFLGAIPIKSSALGFGDHATKIRAQAIKINKPLGLVVSSMKAWEMESKGFAGIKPIQKTDWKAANVRHCAQETESSSATMDLRELKKNVDRIDSHLKQGRSVYVHCNTGYGRSVVVTMAYLLSHTDMSASEAFAHILARRSHISPSKDQLHTIEAYREKYCPDKKQRFTLNDPVLDAFSSWGLGSIIKAPLVHAFVVLIVKFKQLLAATSKVGLDAAAKKKLVGVAFQGAIGWAFTAWHLSAAFIARRGICAKDKLDEYSADVAQLNIKLNNGEKQAFNSGYEAGSSWKGCVMSVITPQAWWNYRAYLGGSFAGRSSREDIKDAVNRDRVSPQ